MSEVSKERYDHIVPKFLLRGFEAKPRCDLTWLFEKAKRARSFPAGFKAFGGECDFYAMHGLIVADPVLSNAESEVYAKIIRGYRAMTSSQVVNSTDASRLLQHLLMRGYGVWGFFGEVIPILCQEVLAAFEKCGLATYIAEQVANQLNKQLDTSMISTGIEDEKLRAILRAVLIRQLVGLETGLVKQWQIGWPWRVIYAPNCGLVLGNVVVLPWNSAGDVVMLDDPSVSAVSITIGQAHILWGGEVPEITTEKVNEANARSSQLWFVSAKNTHAAQELHPLIGTKLNPLAFPRLISSYDHQVHVDKFLDLVKATSATDLIDECKEFDAIEAANPGNPYAELLPFFASLGLPPK